MRPSLPPSHHRIRLPMGTSGSYVVCDVVSFHLEPGSVGTFDALNLILPNTPNIPQDYMYALNGACFFNSLDCLYQHLSMDTHPAVSSTGKHRKHLSASAFYRQFDFVGVPRLITMTQRTNATRCTHIKLTTICRASYKNITNGFIL